MFSILIWVVANKCTHSKKKNYHLAVHLEFMYFTYCKLYPNFFIRKRIKGFNPQIRLLPHACVLKLSFIVIKTNELFFSYQKKSKKWTMISEYTLSSLEFMLAISYTAQYLNSYSN